MLVVKCLHCNELTLFTTPFGFTCSLRAAGLINLGIYPIMVLLFACILLTFLHIASIALWLHKLRQMIQTVRMIISTI